MMRMVLMVVLMVVIVPCVCGQEYDMKCLGGKRDDSTAVVAEVVEF